MSRKLTYEEQQILRETVHFVNYLCSMSETGGATSFDKIETDFVNFLSIQSALNVMYGMLEELGEIGE